MKTIETILLFIVLLLAPVSGNDALVFTAFYDPGRWVTAECTVSRLLDGGAEPMLQMHIPIDYESGEQAYPIGWPRMYFNRKADDPDLSAYDYLEFQLELRNTRSELDYFPINLAVLSGGPYYNRQLLPVHGEKLTVQIPFTELPDPSGWKSFGVNISEADYANGDVVDFTFSRVRLVQLRECRVVWLRVLQPGIYSHETELQLEVGVEGPAAEVARGIPLRLSFGGVNVLDTMVSLPRGKSRFNLPLQGLDLTPGCYQLAMLPETPERGRVVTLQVVEPFWVEAAARGGRR